MEHSFELNIGICFHISLVIYIMNTLFIIFVVYVLLCLCLLQNKIKGGIIDNIECRDVVPFTNYSNTCAFDTMVIVFTVPPLMNLAYE